MPGAVAAGTRRGVTVVLPAALVRLFPGAAERVELEAASVADMLEALDARWPGMRDRLRDSRPAVRRHIAILADGRHASLETPLRPGATVYVLTRMSGG